LSGSALPSGEHGQASCPWHPGENNDTIDAEFEVKD
jgi:hypothetical protein